MKYFITTPIYYVNDLPHIGHAYTTLAADVLSRWRRIKGDDVFFLTGTDEHGAKICEAAKIHNKNAKEFCDEISGGFTAAWKGLRISNDAFIRTTDPEHEKAVQLFLKVLYDSSQIYKSKYEGLYCIECEKFVSSEDLDEKGLCPDHKKKPITHSEENYFFKLSAYRDKLLKMLTDTSDPDHMCVLPVERKNELIGKLKNGLEDISISRSSLLWGISLPFDNSQTAYVWIDALLNYITAIGYGADNSRFQKLWPADLHLMAKDILWFHGIIWPALLIAAKLPVPKKLFAHGFFTVNGEKMSKTIGNVIRPAEMTDKFGVDASRYLSLSLFPFGSDGNISWDLMKLKYNNDLANNLGNLVSRTLTMLQKYFNGIVPPSKENESFSINSIIADADKHIEEIAFSEALQLIQNAIDLANRYIEQTAPWKMAKAEDPHLQTVLRELLRAISVISVYLLPFMPECAEKIWLASAQQLNIKDAARAFLSGNENAIPFPPAGAKIGMPEVLFPRIN